MKTTILVLAVCVLLVKGDLAKEAVAPELNQEANYIADLIRGKIKENEESSGPSIEKFFNTQEESEIEAIPTDLPSNLDYSVSLENSYKVGVSSSDAQEESYTASIDDDEDSLFWDTDKSPQQEEPSSSSTGEGTIVKDGASFKIYVKSVPTQEDSYTTKKLDGRSSSPTEKSATSTPFEPATKETANSLPGTIEYTDVPVWVDPFLVSRDEEDPIPSFEEYVHPTINYRPIIKASKRSALVYQCRKIFLDVVPTVSQLHHGLRFQSYLYHDRTATQALRNLYREAKTERITCVNFASYVCSVLYRSNTEAANRYGTNLCWAKF